jgi:hypothetical protein
MMLALMRAQVTQAYEYEHRYMNCGGAQVYVRVHARM